MKWILAAAVIGMCLANAAVAQEIERDPRLRIVPYQESQVININGHLGYQMMIELDPQERIENVSVGDSLAWQVTPNRAATLLFLKPVEANSSTNMIVVTTRRRYAFTLRAREARGPDDPNILHSLRFTYPEAEAPETSSAPATFAFDYIVSGSAAFAPRQVFDDGQFTYFQIPQGADAPAIFAMNGHGEEEVVNTQVRGAVTVVEQIADRFVLRLGRDAVLVNRASASPSEHARVPRHPRRGRRR